MKELHALLECIDSYVYSKENEEIMIATSGDSQKAIGVYEAALESIGINAISDKAGELLLNMGFIGDRKWMLDIAIDCVRMMSEEERNYVQNHMWTTEYHFGYAMGIRNEFIHSANKHHSYEPDETSSIIMEIIFSIISPSYDYGNPRCTEYYEDFDYHDLSEQYQERAPEVFEQVAEQLLSEESELEADDALKILRKQLANKLGKEEFKCLLRAYYEKKQDEWDDESISKGFNAILFPLETTQMQCLELAGLIEEILDYEVYNVEQCKQYIIENLGFKEEYVGFLADSAFDVFSPFANGKWKNIEISRTELEYCTRTKIVDAGIKTLGELCDIGSTEVLREKTDITEDEANEVKVYMLERGLKWTTEQSSGYKCFLGNYTLTIPEVFISNHPEGNSNTFHARAEVGDKAVLLSISGNTEENEPAKEAWLDCTEKKEEFAKAFIREMADGGDAILTSSIVKVIGNIRGLQLDYEFSLDGLEGEGMVFRFPVEKDNFWVNINLMQSYEAEDDYNVLFESIIGSFSGQ